MSETTTTVGKDGYPMIVTSGQNHHGYNNDIFNNWVGTNETHRASTATLNAITNAENVINKGVYDASVAGIKQTSDSAVSLTKTVTDYGSMNAETTNRNATAVTKAITDSAAAGLLAQTEGRITNMSEFANVREQVGTIGTANAIAAKDIQIAIFKDGAHTREEMQEAICELGKDTAKGFADAALEAAKNKAAIELDACKNTSLLASKIDEICCCVREDNEKTRGLISAESAARQAAQIQRQEMEILMLKSRHDGHK